MYKLMIVDDDYWTREYIKKSIQWKDFNIILAHEAENGEEALQIISQEPVQIILADIKMPVMDGMQLAEEAIKINPEIKTILLSGIKDFEYARKAIRLGVVEYIVKPVLEEDLADVIRKVVMALDEAKSFKRAELSKANVLAQATPIMKEKILFRLLNAGMDAGEIEKSLREAHIGLGLEDTYSVAVCEVDHYSILAEELGLEKTSSLKRKLTELAAGNLKQFTEGVVIDNEGGRFICVLPFHTEYDESLLNEKAFGFCEQLRQQASLNFNTTLTIGLGRPIHGLSKIFISFQQGSEALTSKFYIGNDQVIAFNPIKQPVLTKTEDVKKHVTCLIEAVNSCDRDFLHSLMEKIKNEFLSQTGIENSYIRHSILRLFESLLEGFQLSWKIKQDEICDIYASGMKISRTETLDEMLEVFMKLLEDIMAYVEERNINNTQKLIVDVVNHIRKNYDKDLYVDEIARLFGVHPSYLSRVFKKENGENLLQFIMRVKIDKAMQLLQNPNVKISGIAYDIGYENERTFTRIFKKIVGITPAAYREKVRIGTGGRQSEIEPSK